MKTGIDGKAAATFREILAMRGMMRRLRKLGAYRVSCK